MPGKGTWRWGHVDGERTMRDNNERLRCDEGGRRDRGRRDGDDEDREGRGRNSSRGWRDTIRRSLSRSGRNKDDDQRRQDQGRQRDRSSNRDDGRRHQQGSMVHGLEVAVPTAPSEGEAALVGVPLDVALHSTAAGGGVSMVGEAVALALGVGEMPLEVGAQLAALDLSAAEEDALFVHSRVEQEAPSSGDELLELGEHVRRRGRPRARLASPARSRRRSRAARTPPTTPDPPTSPTGVCPSSPSSKGSRPPSFMLARDGMGATACLSLTPRSIEEASVGARHALQLLSPTSMVPSQPLSCPPGFEASPKQQMTPTLFSPVGFGGSLTRSHAMASLGSSAASSEAPSLGPLEPLFIAQQPALLASPPLVRPSNRRKTLAGVNISYSMRRSSARLKKKRRAKPIVTAAETAVCRNLGIIQDGEEVTEQAMAEFSRRFNGQVPDHVLATMRVLFKVNSPEEEELDMALLGLGGAAALDQDVGEEVLAEVDV